MVLRNARRPDVTSPDYLPNLLGSLDRDGNADSNRSGGKKRFLRKKFLGHIFPGNFGGKVALYLNGVCVCVCVCLSVLDYMIYQETHLYGYMCFTLL